MTRLSPDAQADASGPALAAYYERHMALRDGVAWGWQGRGTPQRQMAGVRQVGVGRDHGYALLHDGRLLRWTDDPARAELLREGVAWFAAGHSGWFATDSAQVLWYGAAGAAAPRRVADARGGCLHRRQCRLLHHPRRRNCMRRAWRTAASTATASCRPRPDFVATAADAVAVKAHTGHAIYLRKDGVVLGTGGNRYGPLSSHGLGDKADRWGPIFDGAVAIATGSRHSLALRADGSLWAWGEGFGIAPRQLHEQVRVVAAGDTVTLALVADGGLWQWDGGEGPRRLGW